MAMAAEAPRRSDDDTRMRLLCSHGGRFLPCGPGGAPRYVGGETRALAVPRDVSFRDLAARLAEVAGGAAEVRAVGHRLADEGLEDVLVSATCDEELAHMRDEYDRLRAARPAARFRVFLTTTTTKSPAVGAYRERATAGRLPSLAPPAMRRVQSERAVAAGAHQHRPTRRVQSAQELAGGRHVHVQPSFRHHRHQQCCFSCQRRDMYTPALPPPARPTTYALPYMSKRAADVHSVSAAKAAPAGQVAAVSTEAARGKAASRCVEAAVEERRAIWEFE